MKWLLIVLLIHHGSTRENYSGNHTFETKEDCLEALRNMRHEMAVPKTPDRTTHSVSFVAYCALAPKD